MPQTALLINPPVNDFKLYDEWMNPLGLLTLSAVLKQMGIRVLYKDFLYQRQSHKKYGRGFFTRTVIEKAPEIEFLNRNYYRFGYTDQEIEETLQNLEFDVAFVGSFVSFWYEGVFAVIRILKKLYPDKPVILGGIYPTLMSEHAQNSLADLILPGNLDEKTIQEIATYFSLKQTDLPNHFSFFIDIAETLFKPFLSLALTLGCPCRCSYCASSFLQPLMRKLAFPPIENFIQAQKKGIQDIALFDDALLYHFDYLVQFVDYLKNAGLSFHFHLPNGLHIGLINKEIAHFFKQNQFITLRFGLEAMDERMQSQSSYKATKEKIENGIAILKKAGFGKQDIGFYLLLSPFVSVESIEKTIAFLEAQQVNIHFSLFSPIPHTPDFEELAQHYPEIREKPLLHNDSVFLAKYRFFDQEWIRKIKNRIRHYNSLVEK